MAYQKKNKKTGSPVEQAVAADVSKSILALKKEFEKDSDIGVKFGSEVKIEYFSTGILSLDYALNGGVPEGRITEFFGEEQSGKTLIAMLMIAEMQKKHPEKAVILADAEQAFDSHWAKTLGIDTDRLIVMQGTVIETVCDAIASKLDKYPISLIVFDSLQAFVTKRENELTIEKAVDQYSLLAKAATIAIRKMQGQISKYNTAIVMISQVRENMEEYGPAWRTGGGKAMKHFGWTRIQVKKPNEKAYLKDNDIKTGVDMECAIIKHRGLVLAKEATTYFRIWFNNGLDKVYDLVNFMINTKMITQAGAWFYYKTEAGEDLRWNGMEAVVSDFTNKPEVFEKAYGHAQHFLDEMRRRIKEDAPEETPEGGTENENVDPASKA